jgi:signal transduction histidine kinase
MFERITDRSILRVLISGFGMVILMLLASGYIGIRNAQAIQQSAERLVREQVVTARLVDEVHREQGALQAVFNNLSKDPDSVDRNEILSQLNEADAAMELVVKSGAGTPDEALWKDLGRATGAFSSEARRLLALEDAESVLLSDDLLERHEEVIEIVQRLIATGTSRSSLAQDLLESKSQTLVKQSVILLGVGLLVALAIAVLTVRVAARMSRKMEWQAGELSRVSWHMLETQETTARRFSHELHDELGQSLTAVKANLAALQNASPGPRVTDCLQLVDESIKNVREMSQLLRPTILDDFGLDASLRWLAERFQQRTGIELDCRAELGERLPDETETHLFRIAQEALTNVARHAGATRVTISLTREGANARLRIGDNGGGQAIQAADGRKGMGLTGMRARARGIGGEFTLRQNGERGLEIDVSVPVQPVTAEKLPDEYPKHQNLISR